MVEVFFVISGLGFGGFRAQPTQPAVSVTPARLASLRTSLRPARYARQRTALFRSAALVCMYFSAGFFASGPLGRSAVVFFFSL